MIYLEQVESDSQKQLVQFIIEEYHSYVPSAVSVGRRIDWLIYDDTIVNQFSLPQPIGMIGIGSSVYPPPKDILNYVKMKKDVYKDNFNSFANNWRFCMREKIKNAGTQILKELRRQDKIEKIFQTEIVNSKIASDQTLKKIRKVMENVVIRGTAKNIYSSNFSMAGKTGTAKKYIPRHKNEKGETIAFCCNGCKNKFMASLPAKPAKTEMASKNNAPLNEMCPIKPGRRADPDITAKNAKGETVAFCCNGCKNKFAAAPPAMFSDMANNMMNSIDKTADSASSRDSYKRSGTPTRDTRSLRASEVGDPAPRGHIILQFGGSPRDQIQVSHKEAAVNQVLAMINGYAEKYLVNNKKSVSMNEIAKGASMEDKINLSFLSILQRKPNTRELTDFKDMIKSLDVKDYHKDIVWALLNSHEFMFVQ